MEFWAGRAKIAARELAEREAEVRVGSRQDLPGLWMRERAAQRAFYDACERSGLAPEPLIETGRAEVAKRLSDAAEANVEQAAGIVAAEAAK